MNFNQTPPFSSSRPAGKTIGLLVAMVVVLVIVAIILVLFKNGNLSRTIVPGNGSVTDAQKAQMLKDLTQQAASAPVVTDAQKAQMLKSLQDQAGQ